jgi:hypothetical protein
MTSFETVSQLKEHYDALHQKDLEALKLQAQEYERRLDALNHEHARIALAQSTYVSYSVLAAVISFVIAAAALISNWLRHW